MIPSSQAYAVISHGTVTMKASKKACMREVIKLRRISDPKAYVLLSPSAKIGEHRASAYSENQYNGEPDSIWEQFKGTQL